MIALIVAYSKNRVIGNKGKIPWYIEGELQRFKELTTGNVVIMGRKTYEEIGHPLPNRMNVVISNTKQYFAENCVTVSSLQEAFSLAGEKDVYIAGGVQVYKEALPYVQKMYVTEVDMEVAGDRYFPEFDESLYQKEINQRVEGDIPYTYVTYTKR